MAVSWFSHRRTRELCAGLGIELIVIETPVRGLLRYLLLIARTIPLLTRRRPNILLVQSPSLVLSFLAVVVRSVLGYRLIVDAHNEAVEPHENPRGWIKWISRWVIRHADLTIVSNRFLAEVVGRQGGKAFVLPDRIPTVPSGPARNLTAGFNVVLIATFAKDEPIEAVFDAVRGVDLKLYVTGNARKLDSDVAIRRPPNACLTGFLQEADYWSLLRSADAIVDLTLKPDCLVCGAYEALAIGKPVLLSGNRASIELFDGAAVFTDNSPADIRRGLLRLRDEQKDLQAAVDRRRRELTERWEARSRALLGELPAGGAPTGNA